ncbi:MAG: PQQ-binding-like beta-propeller repeat protein [Planctomycetaceae bacterium]|jgi:outer membrane protein assembly factor BamB|nr:PQQ-binding-like beta-propeller repeat protein [Planctomycetaceae bacterium]
MKKIFITILFFAALTAAITFNSFWQLVNPQIGLRKLLADELLLEQAENLTPKIDDNNNKEKNKEPEINPFFTQLVTPDRSTERQLEQVERLIKVERYIEAVRIIESLLENSDNYFVPPTYKPRNNFGGKPQVGTNPNERTTNTSFTKRILNILKNLPDKAKETYNIQNKIQAESLLENAVKQGSFETLQKVAKKYLPTEAGITAQFLIGMYQFDHGDWEAALLTFHKINYVAEQFNIKLDSFDPALSLSTASCQIKLEQNNDAKQTLNKFIKKFPQPRILLGGKVWRPTTGDEIFSRLQESIANRRDSNSAATWLEQTGWLTPYGALSQNPSTSANSPLLETAWELPNCNQNEITQKVKKLHALVQTSNDAHIPALQPIIVGNLIITRGMDEISAANIDTGKRVWSKNDNNYQIQPALMQILQNFGMSNHLFNKVSQYDGLLRLTIWHDRLINSMSSDGEKIFYIEEQNPLLRLSSYVRNMQPLIIGNKSVENPLAKQSNTLTARDAKTGNLIWQIGKFDYVQKSFNKLNTELDNSRNRPTAAPLNEHFTPDDDVAADERTHRVKNKDDENNTADKDKEKLFSDEELLFSETIFLGAPLPLQGRLYCICESEGLVQLFVLNPADGKLLSKVPLAQSNRQSKDVLRNLYGLMPSASNGILICPTGLGLVVAIDATTATPIWIFGYEQTKIQEAAAGGRVIRIGGRFIGGFDPNMTDNNQFRNFFAQSGWQSPCIMIDKNRALIAPPDLPNLYCVDLLTGKLLWQMTNLYRPNALYVACIHNDVAYVVTPVSILALSMESGRRLWQQFQAPQYAISNNPAEFSGIRIIAGAGRQVQWIPEIQPTPPQKNDNEKNDNDEYENAAAENDKSSNKTTAAKRPKLVFPTPLKPTGIGVHNGDLYYIPLSGGFIGIVNLAKCSIELVASPESVINAEKNKDQTKNELSKDNLVDQGFNASFGNLIGLRGKFFSQSPTQLTCFDQWIDLNERTKRLLEINPNDANGLLQLGNIRRLENNMSEAIRLFRCSLEVNPTEVAAYYLRQTLMDAVKKDYNAWKHILPELESLALSPIEYGDVLLARAQGAAKSGDIDDFISTLTKVFSVESDFPVNVAFDNNLTSQLHNAVGVLMEQMRKNHSDPQLQKKIEFAAKNIFDNFRNNNFSFKIPKGENSTESVENITFKDALQFGWVGDEYVNSISPEIRCWQIFIELFRTLPIAEEAKELLRTYHAKNQFHLGVEMLTDLSILRNKNAIDGGGFKIRDKARLPKLSDVESLASLLERQGVISDAYYYYKLIDDLYGEEGKKIANEAFKRAAFSDYINRSSKLSEWHKTMTTFQVDNNDNFQRRQNLPTPTSMGRNVQAYALLQIARGNRNQNIKSIPVDFLGGDEPFITPYSYVIEPRNNVTVLVAYDKFGKEHWQFDVSEYYHAPLLLYADINNQALVHVEQIKNARFKTITKFIKGCDHLLIFACRDKLIAIDTFGCGNGSNLKPRFLWARKLSSGNFFENIITNNNMQNVIMAEHLSSVRNIQSFPMRHDVMICVTKNVLCYRENDKLYGVNPITGNTIWIRDIQTEACSLVCDRDSLFLFYPETQRVVAIEPFSGMEIKQGILAGNILTTYGTNVLIDFTDKTTSARKILITDLQDMFLDNDNIEKCDNVELADQNKLFRIEPKMIPARMISAPQSSNIVSMITPLDDMRYISFVTQNSTNVNSSNKEGGRLFIYDMQNKVYAIGKPDGKGIYRGVNLSRVFNNSGNITGFQVFQHEDGFIMMTNSNNANARMNGMNGQRMWMVTDSDGVKYNRNFSPLQAGHYLSEVFMLFDKDGNQGWKESVNANEWYLLPDSTASNVPVFLYAAMVRDQDIQGSHSRMFIGITAIDKATGRKRFRKLLPYKGGNTQFTNFLVDQEEHEIKLIFTDRTITIKFEEESKTDQSTENEENK